MAKGPVRTTSELRPIRLRGVRVHNLKGIDLDLPLHRLIVFTGVSGSGKSSLAFDTLYAEGQRRYIETFSAYTRQFLETLEKPEADRIDGIPPAIAIGQKTPKLSGRGTVGTVTEVHDSLALLYARVGRVVCPCCGAEVRPADADAVIRAVEEIPEGSRYQIAFPVDLTPETDLGALGESLREQGFVRARVDGRTVSIADEPLTRPAGASVEVIVDRLVRGREDPGRRLDSIETAFDKGLGRCMILQEGGSRTFLRGWRCGQCGAELIAPEPRLFQYNSPLGACPECEGFGRVIDLDLDRIVPDPSKSVREGAIVPWTTPAYRHFQAEFLKAARAVDFPADAPFHRLTPEQKRLVVEGQPAKGVPGLRGFFRALERKSYKLHVRVFLARWRSYRTCPACGGARLRPEALAVKVDGLDIAALTALDVSRVGAFLAAVEIHEGAVARRVLEQARARVSYLDRIGLGYLTLDRQARTLSGGESRRVALTGALGSGLVNTLYVLDEPSIGLHPRDVDRLLASIERLRDAGNTVVVVEHETAVIRRADLLVDIGPGAGEAGGNLVYLGTPDGIGSCEASVTGAYLTGRRAIPSARVRRPADRGRLVLEGASGNNLKDIDVEIPLGLICVIAGVSGSGKSTLVEDTLYPALSRALRNEAIPGEPYRGLRGAEALADVALLDQSPIGRSARSNAVTYLKAFDEIRRAFAETHEAKARNYGPGTFSFNVEGGRCNACEGYGYQVIDMQFLPDVIVKCPECRGRRFRPEVLEVTYRGKNIAEVLDLTVREAIGFFRHRPKVLSRLRPLGDVGLDYLRLGQPASTLSGGEAQRLKLAAYLAGSVAALNRAAAGPKTLFLMDEPTTGLHAADVARLLEAWNRLADLGHSLVIVEHSPDVMAAADWIVELGPDAGDAGGTVVAAGTPEDVARAETHTGRVLHAFFDARSSSPAAGGENADV